MIEVKRTNSDDKDFQRLVRELDEYLAVINGTEHDFFSQFNKIDELQHVVVVYEDHRLAGCGAMKAFDQETMEIKRMYVHPSMRRKGIASLVLKELESWCSEEEYSRCVLETSDKMPDAINLYKARDYRIIPNYGQYKNIYCSTCFEKNL